MFLKIVKKTMNRTKAILDTLFGKISAQKVTAREALCNERGSQLVEYACIALAGLVVIVVVVLPGIKNLFGVDIFPGLTTKVNSILGFS